LLSKSPRPVRKIATLMVPEIGVHSSGSIMQPRLQKSPTLQAGSREHTFHLC